MYAHKKVSLELDLPDEISLDALVFFKNEAKYLILLAEDGNSKVMVLK